MIISVASGKGGTGKTLVSTSLALSLKDRERMQLFDCDVEEPDDHLLLNPVVAGSEAVTIRFPEIDEDKCTSCGKCAEICAYHAIAVIAQQVLVFPNLCHGCGACSYLCPEKAINEKEREIGIVRWGHLDNLRFVDGKLNVGEAMPTPVIRKVKQGAHYNGVSVIDVAPGTSCPVVQSIKGSDFCLLVTEPTPFGLNDLILAVEMVKELGIPSGVIINRAGIDNSQVEAYCREEGLPILLTIPLKGEIARFYSRGITLVEGLPQWKERFIALFEQIEELLYERSGGLER